MASLLKILIKQLNKKRIKIKNKHPKFKIKQAIKHEKNNKNNQSKTVKKQKKAIKQTSDQNEKNPYL